MTAPTPDRRMSDAGVAAMNEDPQAKCICVGAVGLRVMLSRLTGQSPHDDDCPNYKIKRDGGLDFLSDGSDDGEPPTPEEFARVRKVVAARRRSDAGLKG